MRVIGKTEKKQKGSSDPNFKIKVDTTNRTSYYLKLQTFSKQIHRSAYEFASIKIPEKEYTFMLQEI